MGFYDFDGFYFWNIWPNELKIHFNRFILILIDLT